MLLVVRPLLHTSLLLCSLLRLTNVTIDDNKCEELHMRAQAALGGALDLGGDADADEVGTDADTGRREDAMDKDRITQSHNSVAAHPLLPNPNSTRQSRMREDNATAIVRYQRAVEGVGREGGEGGGRRQRHCGAAGLHTQGQCRRTALKGKVGMGGGAVDGSSSGGRRGEQDHNMYTDGVQRHVARRVWIGQLCIARTQD